MICIFGHSTFKSVWRMRMRTSKSKKKRRCRL
jgi:hypothetical protein